MKKRWKIWSWIGIPPKMMRPKLIESGISMKWLARRRKISIWHHLSNPRHVPNFHIKSSKRGKDLGFSIQERWGLGLLSNKKWMVQQHSDGNCKLTSGYPLVWFFFFWFWFHTEMEPWIYFWVQFYKKINFNSSFKISFKNQIPFQFDFLITKTKTDSLNPSN